MKTYLLQSLVTALFVFSFLTAFPGRARAQSDTYTSYVKDSSSDFRKTYTLSDNNRSNYSYISNAVGVLNTSYLRVGFPVSGEAGNTINVIIQGSGQVLGVGLLSNITVRLYDSLGNNVATGSGSSLLKLSLLSPADHIYAVRFLTNPTSSYKFKEARIEFNNVLSVNLLNELRVYDVYYQKNCPVTVASGPYTSGTSQSQSLLQGYVLNASAATDADENNFATLVVPLNLLNLLPPAFLDVSFGKPAKAGEFVGFTVGQASSVLSAALLQYITITAYKADGSVITAKSGNLLSLKLLAGTGNKYSIGFVAPDGDYTIARLKISLNGVLNLLQNINIYNAYHYRFNNPPVVIVASGPTTICAEGSVTLTAVDTLGGTNFLWSTGETTQSITVSAPGTYSVQVTDNEACSRTSYPITISTLPGLQLTSTITNTNCNNSSEGAISIVNNTPGNYSYQWSNGATGASISNLSIGLYTVSITNTDNNCSFSRAYTVASQTNLSVNASVVNTSNAGKADGQINVSVSGGSGSYQYSWSSGAAAATLSNVAAGIYYLTVKDIISGCQLLDTITVDDGNGTNNGFTIVPEVTNVNGCTGTKGSISITVTGGSGSYTYLWSTGATTASISDLQEGIYYVAVTDNQTKQIKTATIQLGNTGRPTVTSNITATDCNAATGSIALSVTGGSGNYTYAWSNNASTSSLTGLRAGVYIVTITDNVNGCVLREVYTIGIKNPPSITLNITRPSSANGIKGSVSINAGAGNYTYLWSNGSTDKDQPNLLPGIYILTVTDAQTGCYNVYLIDLSLTDGLYVAATPISNTNCEKNYNGAITLYVKGGIPPYTYSWSNGAVTQNIERLGPGNYTVTVNDAGQNNNTVSVTITTNTDVLNSDCDPNGGITIHDVITPNGDGVNDIWIIDGIVNYPDNNIKVFDKWGDVVYQRSRYDNTWAGTDKNGDLLPAGTYYYLLRINGNTLNGMKTEYTGFITIKR